MEVFATADAWITLATLTLLEIVLGIDNIVFLTIMAGKLPEKQRASARRIGLGLALGSRIALLFSLSWAMSLTEPLFTLIYEFSGRDLILFFGGLFLLAKATHEIFSKVEGAEPDDKPNQKAASYAWVLVQIAIIDIVFSLDSVITAVGMAQDVSIMIIAMVIAVGVMLLAAGTVGDFVERHPSMKILALAFLLLIGAMLVGEGLGQHVNKGYIYFAMGFSLTIELINMRFRKKKQPLHLHGRLGPASEEKPETAT